MEGICSCRSTLSSKVDPREANRISQKLSPFEKNWQKKITTAIAAMGGPQSDLMW